MDRKLIEILACPKCKGPLALTVHAESQDGIMQGSLDCASCSLSYPISEGVPDFCGQQ